MDRRTVLVRYAISASIVAAILVCIVIVMLFTARLFTVQLGTVIACLFIAAMVALGSGFAMFLVETRLAARSTRLCLEILGRQRPGS